MQSTPTASLKFYSLSICIVLYCIKVFERGLSKKLQGPQENKHKKTMLMSRKRNIKKEMFQPTTECVDSLTIDDVTGQAVPESGTGHTYITYS